MPDFAVWVAGSNPAAPTLDRAYAELVLPPAPAVLFRRFLGLYYSPPDLTRFHGHLEAVERG